MLDVMHVASYFLGRASMTPQKLEKNVLLCPVLGA